MNKKHAPLAAILAALACLAAPASGDARPAHRQSPRPMKPEEMLKLDPSARVEQRCNARAMGEVGREHKGMRPDEFVAYAFADTQVNGATVKAPGAAVRSRGAWYHVSYECETADNGLSIRSFSYVLGDEIPKKDWDEHYLVP